MPSNDSRPRADLSSSLRKLLPWAMAGMAFSGPLAGAQNLCGQAAAQEHGGKLLLILMNPAVRLGVNGQSTTITWSRDKVVANRADYAAALMAAAREHLASRAELADAAGLPASVQECLKDLNPLMGRLSRGNLNDEAEEVMKRIGGTGNILILAQSIHVEPGPGSTWNAMSGAITSAAQSTQIEIALIALATHTVVWKEDRLIRNRALQPGERKMLEALDAAYQTFPSTLEAQK